VIKQILEHLDKKDQSETKALQATKHQAGTSRAPPTQEEPK